MKKWRRGKGMRFTASLRRSELSCPGNRRQQVTPLIVAEMRWFRSPTERTKPEEIPVLRTGIQNQTLCPKRIRIFTQESNLKKVIETKP
jgi:hypothetical protein